MFYFPPLVLLLPLNQAIEFRFPRTATE